MHVLSRLRNHLSLWTIGSLLVLTITLRVIAEITLLDYSGYVPALGAFDTYARLYLENLYYFVILYTAFAFYVAWLARTTALDAARFLITFAPFGVLPPVIDHFVFGRSVNYTYGTVANLAENVRTFALTSGDTGYGIGLFALGAVVSIAVYIYRKRRVLALALASIPITSTVIMVYSTPDLFFGAGKADYGFDHFIPLYYLLPASLLLGFLAWRYRRRLFLAALRHLRLSKGLFFIGAVVLGYFTKELGAASLVGVVPPTRLILAALAAFLLWLFSVAVNDIYDVTIDRQTNRERPLVTNDASPREYAALAVLLAILGLSCAALTNVQVFLAGLAFLALGYAYSAPPLRLRRHFVLANMTIGLSLVLAYIMGLFAMWDGGLAFLAQPDLLTVYGLIVVLGMIVFSAKDAKDRLGDARDGVTTLFTAFGHRSAIGIVLASLALISTAVPIVIGAPEYSALTLTVAILAGALYRRRLDERYVYLGGFLVFILAYVDLFYYAL